MRDIDRVIEFVQEYYRLSPVHKQVLISRIELEPTEEEIVAAKKVLDSSIERLTPIISTWAK